MKISNYQIFNILLESSGLKRNIGKTLKTILNNGNQSNFIASVILSHDKTFNNYKMLTYNGYIDVRYILLHY